MTFDPATAKPDTSTFDPSTAAPEDAPPVRSVLSLAVKQNPDQAARASALGKQYGVPQDVVLRNLQDVEFQAAVDKADERLKTSPKLAAAMRKRPDIAPLAHDDIEPLAKIESSFATVAAASVGQGVLGISESIWRTPDALQRMVGYAAGQLERTGLPRNLNPVRGVQDAIRLISEGRLPIGPQLFTGTTGVADQISSATDMLATDRGTFGNAFADVQTLGKNADLALANAVKSGQLGQLGQVVTDPAYWSAFIAQAVPSLYVAIKSGGSLGMMGWLEGMEQAGNAADFEKRTGQKISDADFTQAVAQTAIVNAVLEKTGVDKVLGAKGKGLKGIAQAVFGEGGTEALQQINSNLSALLAYNPDQGLLEGVVSSFMGGAGAGGAVSSAQVAADKVADLKAKNDRQKQDAEKFADALNEQLKTAGSALLRERSPEQFRELMGQMSDGAVIHVDGAVLNQLASEVLAALPEAVRNEIATAAAIDTTVAIPVADVLTVAPGTPLEQVLVENARMTPDAESQASAKAAAEAQATVLMQQAERVMQQAADQEQARTDYETVRSMYAEQIKATGRYRPAVAETMPHFLASFFTAYGSRMGLSAVEMQARYPVRVLAEPSAVGAAPAAPLEQPGTPAFNAWFGDSKVVDADGKPLVVYHGAPDARFATPGKGDGVFKTKREAAFGKDDGRAFFFAASQGVARTYADPRRAFDYQSAEEGIVPVYLSLRNPLEIDAKGEHWRGTEGVIQQARAAGHDGVIIRNSRDTYQGRKEDKNRVPVTDVYVAFNPEQIKSATGNQGTYDPNDPSILRQSAVLQQRGEQKPGKPVPAAVDAVANVNAAFELANGQQFKTNRDLKLALQERVLEALKVAKVNLEDFNAGAEQYLVRVALMDAEIALETNPNAVGWYNEKVTKALRLVALVHPEIQTDPQAKFAFVWAMAVTSNGLKVDKNFELAEVAYSTFKSTGKMPTNIQAGQAQAAINNGLALFNEMLAKHGFEALQSFMTTKATVKEIQNFSGLEVGGENLTTEVYGSAILGPKIGNGFFSNLYGRFEQLTMDRWLMRTWGRWTGTLIETNPEQVRAKRVQLRALIQGLDKDQKKAFEAIIKRKLTVGDTDAVALAIWKASQKPINRARMAEVADATDGAGQARLASIMGPLKKGQKRISFGDELRKVGNSLTKYNDGQKEAPSGPPERNRIRKVFGQALAQLQARYPALTMSDLQALLWYPEKRLYDAAKEAGEGETGYEDDAAPDYANAAAKLAREKGVPDEDIARTVEEVDNELRATDRAAGAGRTAGAEAPLDQTPAGGVRDAGGVRGSPDVLDPQAGTLEQSARGTYNPATLELVLNPNANLSTFFHETGHFFLEVLADIASQPNPPAQIAEDFATFLKWADTTPEQWRAWQQAYIDSGRTKIPDGMVRIHERWAESIEQYVMEGKAPSVELQPLMRRFASWLKSVYGSIKQFLAARGVPVGGGGALEQSGEPYGNAPNSLLGYRKNGPQKAFGTSKFRHVEYVRVTFDNGASMVEAMDGLNKAHALERARRNWQGAEIAAISQEEAEAADPGITAAVEDARYRQDPNAQPGPPLQLNDDIRRVMDRMLATDEQIAQANEVAGLVPELEADAAAAERLNKRSMADLKWQVRARDQVIGKLRKEAAAIEKDIRQQVTVEVDQTPEMRAKAALDALQVTPEFAAILVEHKARRAAAQKQAEADVKAALLADNPEVKGLFKGQLLAKNKRDMANKVEAAMIKWDAANPAPKRPVNATDADVATIADSFGFEGVDAMMQAIDAFGSRADAIDGLTQQRMLEEHGDLIDDRAIQQAANEAVHNEARARSLATELRTQREMLNPRQDKVPPQPPNTTRFYHGGSPEAVTGPLWFTADLRDANGWAARGEGMQVWYVDVPNGAAGVEWGEPENGIVMPTRQELPAELAGLRKPLQATNAKGQKITVNALVEAAKQFAANVVGKTPVADLRGKAWQHTAAERRASKRWTEATSAGKTEEAVKAKQDQMLNHAAAKAALDAQAEARKILDFFKRVAKGNDEKVVKGGRDADIVNAARAVLAAYGMGTGTTKRAAEYLDTVKTNDPDTYNAIAPMVDAAVQNAQPMTALTVDELRMLNEHIAALWYLAKRSRQSEVDGNLLDREDLADELFDRMQEIGIPDRVPGEGQAVTKAEERTLFLRQGVSFLRRVEQWAEGMDGKYGGPFLRYVFQPIKAAADRYRADRTAYRKRLDALIQNIAPIVGDQVIKAPELDYTFGAPGSTVGTAMNEILHAILHTGNPSNKRKLLLGRKWATENADGTLDTSRWDAFIQRLVNEGKLQPAHFDFVQGLWDLMEDTKPLAQKAHRDVFGRYFDEVTAESFTDPWGQVRRGGYAPAVVDPAQVPDNELRKLAEAENENMTFAFPAPAKGFTIKRVEGYDRPLLLDLRTIGQHIDKVLLFSHMTGPAADVRRLITHKKVGQPLTRIDPSVTASMLQPWLQRSAQQVVETPIAGAGKWARVPSVVRARAGAALMFANVSNAIQQVTGLSTAMVKVKPSFMLRAMAQHIAHPVKAAQTVWAASPYMDNRAKDEVAVLAENMRDVLINPSVYEKAQAWSLRHAYFLQTALDNALSPVVWTGAYNQAMAEGMGHDDAVKFADGTVRQTQGSTLPEDVSRFETGPAYARAFTQFIGYFNMVANTNGTALKQIADEVGLKRGAGRAFSVVMLGLMVPIWAAEAIALAFKGGPDDEDDDGYLDDWLASVFGFGTVKGLLAMIPIAGQAANSAVSRLDNNPMNDRISLSPGLSFMESALGGNVQTVYEILKDDKEVNARRAVRDAATLVSVFTGLPAYAVARPAGYLAGIADNKIEPTGPVDFARGLITGTPSPESKQR